MKKNSRIKVFFKIYSIDIFKEKKIFEGKNICEKFLPNRISNLFVVLFFVSSSNKVRLILHWQWDPKEMRAIEIRDIPNIFKLGEISFESYPRGNRIFSIFSQISFYILTSLSLFIASCSIFALSISQSRWIVDQLNINQKDIVEKNFQESRRVVGWRLVKANKVEGSIVIEKEFG